jgi:hypothetical protein
MTPKLTEVVWTFYQLLNKSYELHNLVGRKSFNTPKILLNSINLFTQVVPLDRTFHQDSNKI